MKKPDPFPVTQLQHQQMKYFTNNIVENVLELVGMLRDIDIGTDRYAIPISGVEVKIIDNDPRATSIIALATEEVGVSTYDRS